MTDVYPTILEASQLTQPTWLYGTQQAPVDGVSMLYSLNDPAAPTHRTTQYFEAGENAAIYHDGWIAATTPMVVGMTPSESSGDLEDRHWELYRLDNDFSEAVDLAPQEPKRLRQLEDLFWVEAARNNVLPIHRFDPPGLAAHNDVRHHYVFFPARPTSPRARPRRWTAARSGSRPRSTYRPCMTA